MDDTNQNTNPVEDAEIVPTEEVQTDETQIIEAQNTPEKTTEETNDAPVTDAFEENGAMSILRLEELIKRHIGDIEKYSVDLKEKKSMFDDTFETDLAYREAEEKFLTAEKEKNAVKERILSLSSMVDLKQEMLGIRDQIKELKMTLSDYLKEYEKQTQSNQIEIQDGDMREIVTIARVVKPRKQ